jgi:hypothetical protein
MLLLLLVPVLVVLVLVLVLLLQRMPKLVHFQFSCVFHSQKNYFQQSINVTTATDYIDSGAVVVVVEVVQKKRVYTQCAGENLNLVQILAPAHYH